RDPYRRQPFAKGVLRRKRNDPVRDHRMPAPVAFDPAPAGALRSAVDAQHPHELALYASASMSFSSTSKLEYTFCTSSCSSSNSLSFSIPEAVLPSSFIMFFRIMAISADSVGIPAF